MVAYCDDEKKQCACKPSDKQEVVERKDSESEESEEEKSSNSVNPETTVSPGKVKLAFLVQVIFKFLCQQKNSHVVFHGYFNQFDLTRNIILLGLQKC